jgi:RNA polymerase subunit RPABC4/transcription elongation factor Spt4
MEINCEHIYKDMQQAICPKCNKPSHSTDWSEIAKAHKTWIKENPNYKYTWWSI